MSKYEYSPLSSEKAQIRLLRIPFDIKQQLRYRNPKPLSGGLTIHSLPLAQLSHRKRIALSAKLPIFTALSYVWGEPSRSHEILVDGKVIPITANLHTALRDLQSAALTGDTYVWADAICINQEDLAERSAQIRLMRWIYHTATDVRVWLGPQTDETMRCARFIMRLAGGSAPVIPPKDGEPEVGMETFMKSVLIPSGVIIKAGVSFGQAFVNLGDIMNPTYRDDKAKLVLDPDANLSLHEETIEELGKWRPSAHDLRLVQDEGDFREVADVIDRVFVDQCDWFERMWVVQEVGTAENVELQVGMCSIPWRYFLRVIHYLHYCRDIPMKNIRKVTNLEKIRIGWNDGKRQPLRDLIQDCRYRHASDPRDEIYSLLGLMGDPMTSFLEPDYSKSVAEVYANATLHLITQHQSLDVVCGQQIHGRSKDLPSWVPDFALNQTLAVAPLVRTDGRESIYCASGYDSYSKFPLGDISILASSWKTLHLRGIIIDKVSKISEPSSGSETTVSTQEKWTSVLRRAGDLIPGGIEGISDYLVALSSMISTYSNQSCSPASELNNTTPTISTGLDGIPKIVMKYIHTLMSGRISTHERLTKDHIKEFMSKEVLSAGEYHQHISSKQTSVSTSVPLPLHSVFGKALASGILHRRFIVTSKGNMGAAPQEAKAGDVVAILFGCSVPVVLRELAISEAEHEESRKERAEKDGVNNRDTKDQVRIELEGTYSFVGEAYLNGFMDAEAIVDMRKRLMKISDFWLV